MYFGWLKLGLDEEAKENRAFSFGIALGVEIEFGVEFGVEFWCIIREGFGVRRDTSS